MASKHFAIYKGIPGNLLLSQTELAFESIKGFRTLSTKLFRRSAKKDPALPQGPNSAILLRLNLADIALVRKESRFDVGIFDTDGLLIKLDKGTIVRFASVNRRNEAFAFLLAHSGHKAR